MRQKVKASFMHVVGKKISPTPLGYLGGSKNWTDQDRLTGEKQTDFAKFLHIHGKLHKRMKTRSYQKLPEQEVFIPFRQTVNLWRFGKTKRFVWGVVNGEKARRKIRESLMSFVSTGLLAPSSSSLVIRVFPLFWVREGTFHMGVWPPVSGKEGKETCHQGFWWTPWVVHTARGEKICLNVSHGGISQSPC